MRPSGIFGIETAWTRGHGGDHRVAVIDPDAPWRTSLLDRWPCYLPHRMDPALVRTFAAALADLSDTARRGVWQDNAIRVYRIGAPD